VDLDRWKRVTVDPARVDRPEVAVHPTLAETGTAERSSVHVRRRHAQLPREEDPHPWRPGVLRTSVLDQEREVEMASDVDRVRESLTHEHAQIDPSSLGRSGNRSRDER